MLVGSKSAKGFMLPDDFVAVRLYQTDFNDFFTQHQRHVVIVLRVFRLNTGHFEF